MISLLARSPRAAVALIATICLAIITHQARANPPGTSYRLVFADEFNGTTLDTSKWSAASPSWTMPNSASTATASDVSVANGVLTLNAQRNGSSTTFNSGSISSYQKYQFTGGYVEARIQLPSTPGSWPAFWGLYTGWPPEADIMEYPLTTDGGASGLANNKYNTNYHYTNTAGAAAAGAGVVTTGSSLAGTWHTFGMQWISNTSVAFYLDGNQVSSYTGSSVSQMSYMYMILDYAVGGWPGTPSLSQWAAGHTDQTLVDWVRVWQTNPNSDAPTSWNVNGSGAFGTSSNWTAGVPSFGNEVATFGRVGTANSANISLNAWQVFGGITFDGNATGTTAYTLGVPANQIQLASTSSSGVTVQATAASTVSQTINAGVELWSNTTFSNNMTGNQTLNLNGNLSGAGVLTVSGPGTVVLSGTNSYAGGTVIDANQEAAVLEANSNLALSTGSVVIGSAGNATTAKLEVIGSHTLANNIDFRGRNNNSVGIESLSGNNVLSGTISANVGGGTYQIQSDAGSLSLTGAASGATAPGVALQATATGGRTFTLQGAGNGFVSGNIANGSGTVSIAKSGTGNWTFTHVDTYTGTTTINGGSLVLNVPNAIAATSQLVLNGGTLATNGQPQDFTTSAGPATLALGSTAGSALDLGFSVAPANFKFADSHLVPWTGSLLTIQNWTYGFDHLSFGAGGLSAAQLSTIQFADFAKGASLVSAANAGAGRSIGEVTPLIGDVNGDGQINGADVSSLMQALADCATYQQDRATGADGMTASPTGIFSTSDMQFSLDINGDGQINNADTQSLISLIANAAAGSGTLTAVPEPTTFLLMAVGLITIPALAHRARRRPRT